MIQALVFDLDDTLYQERDFVESGCRAVAHYVSVTYSCNFQQVFSTMMDVLGMHGRETVLPVIRERFLDASIPLAELVEVYRRHNPTIRLFPGYLELLRKFARHHRLGIITDGLPEVQERKVRALGLESVMDRIIYTWEYGFEKEKPHPFCFSLMLQLLRAKPDFALFVGDNPHKDCKGAHAVGMKCAQIHNALSARNRIGGTEHEAPEFIIDSLFQLPSILQQINRDERN